MGGVGVPLEKGVDAGRRPERCTTHISAFSASNNGCCLILTPGERLCSVAFDFTHTALTRP
jgi:hypothetical protein